MNNDARSPFDSNDTLIDGHRVNWREWAKVVPIVVKVGWHEMPIY